MEAEDASENESDDRMDIVMAVITNIPVHLHTTKPKTKFLHTHVPIFKGQHENYNEYKHLLLNHIRAIQNKFTEEEKLDISLNSPRKDAIQF